MARDPDSPTPPPQQERPDVENVGKPLIHSADQSNLETRDE
jgi:hypothetical protein